MLSLIMSRQKHIRKVLVIGMIEQVNDGEFSLVMKLQPKWTDEENQEKLGKPFNVEVFFDNDIVDKYKSLLKTGQIIQVEGSLKNYRWQESDGMKKKRIVINIGKYDSSVAVLAIKKEADMPYLNKVFLLGSCFKANIRATQDGRLMGIFPLLTKKTYKDRNTGEIVENDEWLDVFIFNEMLLKNYQLGEVTMENKLIFIEGQLQASNNMADMKNNITVTKKSDNKFFVIDTVKTPSREGEEHGSNQNTNYKNPSMDINLDDDLPF